MSALEIIFAFIGMLFSFRYIVQVAHDKNNWTDHVANAFALNFGVLGCGLFIGRTGLWYDALTCALSFNITFIFSCLLTLLLVGTVWLIFERN
jgi:hypothetical protein